MIVAGGVMLSSIQLYCNLWPKKKKAYCHFQCLHFISPAIRTPVFALVLAAVGFVCNQCLFV